MRKGNQKCRSERLKSVEFKWGTHIKGWDDDIKGLFVIYIFHLVSSVHFANFGTEVTAADVLIGLAGIDLWLYAHNSFALNLTQAAIAVVNIPVPAYKFNRKYIVVFNGNFIRKHKLAVYRVAVFRLIVCFHTNGNTFRYF